MRAICWINKLIRSIQIVHRVFGLWAQSLLFVHCALVDEIAWFGATSAVPSQASLQECNHLMHIHYIGGWQHIVFVAPSACQRDFEMRTYMILGRISCHFKRSVCGQFLDIPIQAGVTTCSRLPCKEPTLAHTRAEFNLCKRLNGEVFFKPGCAAQNGKCQATVPG